MVEFQAAEQVEAMDSDSVTFLGSQLHLLAS